MGPFVLQEQGDGQPLVFKYTGPGSSGSPITSNTGFMACSSKDPSSDGTGYGVYANLTGVDYSWAYCNAMNPLVANATAPGAYEYD